MEVTVVNYDCERDWLRQTVKKFRTEYHQQYGEYPVADTKYIEYEGEYLTEQQWLHRLDPMTAQ
jgi:hypothetical protein